jgi:hypothetical protein
MGNVKLVEGSLFLGRWSKALRLVFIKRGSAGVLLAA